MKLYLSSDEYNDFSEVKEILTSSKLIFDYRTVIVIEVDKPLIGQKYDWGSKDITKLYITNRFKQDIGLWENFNKFPVYINVLIPKNPENINPISFLELKNIAWACIYDNEQDAKNHAF